MREYDEYVVFNLQPVRSIHLNSDFMNEAEPNGSARSVNGLQVIAFFLLIIAWVNYINLSTSRAPERAREVGMRKVSGASRKQLLIQFLLESVMNNFLAILLAVLGVFLLAPSFNLLTGQFLNYSLRANPLFWGGILILFISGAFISGIYPALLLTSLKPVTVFRGISELRLGGHSMRKALVIFQFAVSILLIIGTLTVYRQISFMKNSDLGVNIKNVLVLKSPSVIDSSYMIAFMLSDLH